MDNNTAFRATSVLGNGISWYFSNLRTIVPLSAIAVIPELICYVVFPSGTTGTGVFSARDVVPEIVSFLAGVWLMGAIIHSVVYSLRSGEEPSWRESAAYVLRNFAPFLLLSLFLGIAIGIGFVLLMVPGILLLVRFWFALPDLIVERNSFRDALGRSVNLSAGHRWTVLQIFIGEILLSFVINSVIAMAVFVLAWLVGGEFVADGPGMFTAEGSPPVVLSLLWVISFGLSATITATSYVELRTLRDADDASF